jgi:threonine aldolase
MANLTAIMTWCNGRGEEAIGTRLILLMILTGSLFSVGDRSHIFLNEGGGAAYIAGVSLRTIPNQSDGTLSIDHIKTAVRSADIHNPITRLLSLENTQNFTGGRVLSLQYLEEVSVILQEKNIALHIDGARIWNAAIATGESVATLCRPADSISVCMSKGLGAPVGSLLIGSNSFILRARKIRKALGGGMRQVGLLGIACHIALDDYENNRILHQDHAHAKTIGTALSSDLLYSIRIEEIESNMVVVKIQDLYLLKGLTAQIISQKLKLRNIYSNPLNDSSLRVVTHRDLTEESVERIIRGFQEVSEDIRKEL